MKLSIKLLALFPVGIIAGCAGHDTSSSNNTFQIIKDDALHQTHSPTKTLTGSKRVISNNQVVSINVDLADGTSASIAPDYSHPDSLGLVMRAPAPAIDGVAYDAISLPSGAEAAASATAYVSFSDLSDAYNPLAEASLIIAGNPSLAPSSQSILANAQFNGSYLGHIVYNSPAGTLTNQTSIKGDVTLKLNNNGTGILAGPMITNRVPIGTSGQPLGSTNTDIMTDGGPISGGFSFTDIPVYYDTGVLPTSAWTQTGKAHGVITDTSQSNPEGYAVGGLILRAESNATTPDPNLTLGSCRPNAGSAAEFLTNCILEAGVFSASAQ